jgi:hypothetical protein
VNRRLGLALALVAAVLVAVLAGDPTTSASRSRVEPDLPVAAAPASASSHAWFCAGLPPSVAPDTSVLVLANPSTADAMALVTAHPDGDERGPAREVAVPAGERVTVPAAELGGAGAVVVEAFAPELVVESGTAAAGHRSFEPCATTTARAWYFAAGTTARGVEQWLVLFNPLGTDAKVDLALATEEGAVRGEALSAIDVPRRTRVVVPIHERAVRKQRVAVRVEATVGRVVAEQTIVFGEGSGGAGHARSSGSVAPAAATTFATATTVGGAASVVAVLNPDVVAAEVDVSVVGTDAVVEPTTVRVPGEGVVWVRVGRCGSDAAECVAVPPELTFGIEVVSDTNTPVVAEHLRAGQRGATVTSGAATGSRRWVFATTGADGEADATLALANPGAEEIDVEVVLWRAGGAQPLDGAAVVIGASGRVSVDLAAATEGAVVVVEASGPVVAARRVDGPGDLALAPGVPAAR